MSNVQVLPSGGKWRLDDGDEEFETQASAIEAGRAKVESSGGGELVIHGEDGQIRAKDTIGRKDPRDIPG